MAVSESIWEDPYDPRNPVRPLRPRVNSTQLPLHRTEDDPIAEKLGEPVESRWSGFNGMELAAILRGLEMVQLFPRLRQEIRKELVRR